VKETIRAAFVIGRRDFTAIIFSKAFFFFLLGPLFPVLVGVAAGALGGQVARDISRPVIGVTMDAADSRELMAARAKLAKQIGEGRLPELKLLAPSKEGPDALLKNPDNGLVAVLEGSLNKPKLVGTEGPINDWKGEIALLSTFAKNGDAMNLGEVETRLVQQTAGNEKQQQLLTAQAAQTLIFFLTMLLAGMVMSNMVEEKANKIIEVLAAAVPMDSVFIGKLFAMLLMAFIGIIVWASVGVGLVALAGSAVPALPTPAVGWPMFAILCVVYFAMAYLVLGSLFIGIGAMAATVREVQTLSMPVTMLQLINFFFAMYTVAKIDTPAENFAAIFPFTSPFAMIARAAQVPTLWHHGVAIVGQGLFALLVIRIGVWLFRRNVMKSGNAGRVKDKGGKPKLFGVVALGKG
jgi:ABC-2 type transport system permease protein